MAKSQRTKGQSGEREVAKLLRDITGLDVRRRVRQHDGDSDIEGIPGWSVEVKRDNFMSANLMWQQAVVQARKADAKPLLLYRRDRKPWVARWMLYRPLTLTEVGWVESPPETWWEWVIVHSPPWAAPQLGHRISEQDLMDGYRKTD